MLSKKNKNGLPPMEAGLINVLKFCSQVCFSLLEISKEGFKHWFYLLGLFKKNINVTKLSEHISQKIPVLDKSLKQNPSLKFPRS